MVLFETKRLIVRSIHFNDKAQFVELLSDPEIIEPVPQQPLSKEVIDERFKLYMGADENSIDEERSVWGIEVKGNKEMIGLCAILMNDENDREIGYRFRKAFWGMGYGTEVTERLLEYCFNTLKLEKITADVNVTNTGSRKILEKFLKFDKEFENEKEGCIDRRYFLYRSDWGIRK